jgi:hypothetical protein
MTPQRAVQTAHHSPAPSPAGGVLQRKCGCGRHTPGGGSCSSCRKKRAASLHRAAAHADPVGAIPPVVHEVLRSPGRPLGPAARAFFEPRFGQDFSGVRVHTDPRAAASAEAVGALAYTVGRHVVFGAGQYAPGTAAGRRLLAHELAHVVQQRPAAGTPRRVSPPSDPLERAAEDMARAVVDGQRLPPARASETATPTLARRILRSTTHCPAGTNGATADPLQDLGDRDDMARDFTSSLAQSLHSEAGNVRAGLGFTDSDLEDAYEARFGLPNAEGKGFLNRLTGQVRPTEEVALSEELEIMSRRFGLLSRLFSQFISYRCIGGRANFAGCAPPHCNNVFAWSCAGIGAIFLCPDFWDTTQLDSVQSDEQQAGILAHEAAHINFADIGDTTLRGPGRNFRVAECYASLIADTFGFPSPVAPCPAPPTTP